VLHRLSVFCRLAQLKSEHCKTELFWLIKQTIDDVPMCYDANDPLANRRRLAQEVNEIYQHGQVFSKIYTQAVVLKVEQTADSRVNVHFTANGTFQTLFNIDTVIANTGSQPDRTLYEQLSVHECYRTKGPMALAVQLLASAGADCLQQTSHGANSLVTTEENFFIVGNKSYGKQTNFLMQIGFQQAQDIFQLIHVRRVTQRDIEQ
jgi:hypothetical protein